MSMWSVLRRGMELRLKKGNEVSNGGNWSCGISLSII